MRVVLKDFPVLGPNSVDAAVIASAARKQISGDKFFDFHQKLLLSHGPSGATRRWRSPRTWASTWTSCRRTPRIPLIRAGLEDVMKVADSLNLTGTPSYVVGDEAVVGAVGLDGIEEKGRRYRQVRQDRVLRAVSPAPLQREEGQGEGPGHGRPVSAAFSDGRPPLS